MGGGAAAKAVGDREIRLIETRQGRLPVDPLERTSERRKPNMKSILFLTLFSLLTPAIAPRPQPGDDTLTFYLKKSDLVVIGKVMNAPVGVSFELGVIEYLCEIKVGDVLKGDPTLEGTTIKARIVRFMKDPRDAHPLLAKGAECTVFLEGRANGTPAWKSADPWFALQSPSPWMARSLKRLAKK